MPRNDYVIRVLNDWAELPSTQWNALLQSQPDGQITPFMRHEYLAALHQSGSATAQTGWTLALLTLWHRQELAAACAVYRKTHSYGEYVFDWAWAQAYQQHGLEYYPKALVASPFTPVTGPRLLAIDDQARHLLLLELLQWCQQEKLSSLHLLFLEPAELKVCQQAGLMARQTVQFHWHNRRPGRQDPFENFDAFLTSLSQDKRKKIRQERRKVTEAGVNFRWSQGHQIRASDWDFFYRCYERTYLEHGNAPYLSRDFFHRIASELPAHWLLFIAERGGRPIASSLVGLSSDIDAQGPPRVAYGRYWGALERVDCLHFEACYYQPLEWCIAQGVQRFEGGAQGEHKMARALMPTQTHSAHWLAHPAFAQAVERFLQREDQGVEAYLDQLQSRTPFRQA
jgi:predicted N-acyltransferase